MKKEELIQQEDKDSEEKEKARQEQEAIQIKSFVSLGSPEAIVAFTIAGLIDLLGFIIIFVGLDDFFILDTVGFMTLGMWMIFRSGHIPSRNSKIKSKKMGKKLLKRLGLSTLCEIMPYLGGLMPTWMLMVYFELKNNPT